MKFLIVAPSWLGDTIMAHSLIQELKYRFCDCTIDVVANAWTFDVLERLPYIDNSILFNSHHGKLDLRERIRVAKILSKNSYDQVFILPNSLKSSLIGFFAGIKKRTGWTGEGRYIFLNDHVSLKPDIIVRMVDRYAQLSLPLKERNTKYQTKYYPKLIVNKSNQSSLIKNFNLGDNPTVAICPGAAYGSAKMWPVEYYVQVAKYLESIGYQILIFGSKNDSYITDEITKECKRNTFNFAGKLKLNETIDLISVCDIVICNDSGLMHVAAALNKKIIAIFGPTSYKHTPPLCDSSTIVSVDVSCSPCFAKMCKYKHNNCMIKLMPEQIIESFDKLMSVAKSEKV